MLNSTITSLQNSSIINSTLLLDTKLNGLVYWLDLIKVDFPQTGYGALLNGICIVNTLHKLYASLPANSSKDAYQHHMQSLVIDTHLPEKLFGIGYTMGTWRQHICALRQQELDYIGSWLNKKEIAHLVQQEKQAGLLQESPDLLVKYTRHEQLATIIENTTQTTLIFVENYDFWLPVICYYDQATPMYYAAWSTQVSRFTN